MELKVYTQRWDHYDTYNVNMTSTGWEISHNLFNGECDKEGKPFLFDILKQDCVSYPADLGIYMELLWEIAEQKNATEDDVQKHLNTIGEWITVVEQNTPDYSYETF